MAKNNSSVKVSVEKGELVIRLKMDKNPKPSGSGKSLVVASTRGIHTCDLEVDGKALKLGVNAFIENK